MHQCFSVCSHPAGGLGRLPGSKQADCGGASLRSLDLFFRTTQVWADRMTLPHSGFDEQSEH